MAGATELPELVREFTDMSVEYLRQETLGSASRLGRYAGFVVGAALSFAVGAVLLSIAGARAIIDVLPDGSNWSALGYLITALVMALILALLIKFAEDDRKRE